MKKAMLWKKEGLKTRCNLCARRCLIDEGKVGFCSVRKNIKGVLHSLNYGKIIAMHVDPIEKKPFFHFLPGSNALSIASAGCNFACEFCFLPSERIFLDGKLVRIEECYENFNNELPFKNGFVKFVNGNASTLNFQGKKVKIEKFYKHFFDGEILKIKPYYFPAIHCTQSHKFLVFNKERKKIEEIRADQLNKNHMLLVPKFKNLGKFLREIGIAEFLKNCKKISKINYRFNKGIIKENSSHLFLPIRKIEKEHYKGFVYNLETNDNSHSYICNFVCVKNCCNWQISQIYRDSKMEKIVGEDYEPRQIVELAVKNNCKSISTTYTEPTIFFEFAYDVGKIARKEGLKNNFVTNGYLTEEAINEAKKFLDAAVVDIKGCLDPKFYLNYMKVPKVEPILDCIKTLHQKKIFVEITNLIVPKIGDNFELFKRFVNWVVNELGNEIPVHVLRFTPEYKLQDLSFTPIETLEKMIEIAKNAGLKYVYIGNVWGHENENTYCPNCNETLIKRYGFYVEEMKIKNGRCFNCGIKINLIT